MKEKFHGPRKRIFSIRITAAPVGPQATASRACGGCLQHAHAQGREHPRVPALELDPSSDIWQYIHTERIPIVPLFTSAAERPVVTRDGVLIMVGTTIGLPASARRDRPEMRTAFASGRWACYPLTGAIESDATTLPGSFRKCWVNPAFSERQGAA